MNYKSLFKISLLLFILIALIYVISGIKSKTTPGYTAEVSADGQGMVFSCFNKENKKAMEIKCSESSRESEDKLFMKDIYGLIFKKGRMKKDIKVFADQGYVENNFFNFYIEKNARLASKDFIISSQSFTMKDRAELHSSSLVSYQTDVLKGNAKEGMDLFLNNNTLKFQNTKGTYKKDNRHFSFQANAMWVFEESDLLVMEKDVVIKDKQSLLRSDWVTFQFNENMKQVLEVSTQNKSYFYWEDLENNEIKEIKSENITGKYDENGHFTELNVMQNSEVLIKGENRQTFLSGDIIKMNFDGPTGRAKQFNMPLRGVIDNKGKTRFKVVADTIDVNYNDAGEISFCQGTGNVEFIIEDYQGKTNEMQYEVEKDSLILKGDDSQLINKINSFTSSKFKVDVKKKEMWSMWGVKSIIKMDKANALFTIDPIFINSQKIFIFEKNDKFKYEQQVSLTQEYTQLSASILEIGENNTVSAKQRVSLAFKKGERDVALQGQELTFNPENQVIQLIGNGVIKSGESILHGDRFNIVFNEKEEIESIIGEGKIYFTKEEISGTSLKVEWLFNRDIMILTGNPEVINTSGGKTSGKELRIHLDSNKISIISDKSERSETIIR